MRDDMDYQEFCACFKEEILKNEIVKLTEEDYRFYPDGFTTEEPLDLAFIRNTNVKYNNLESDVLRGDFAELTVRRENNGASSARFHLNEMYARYREMGWDGFWQEIIEGLPDILTPIQDDVLNHIREYPVIKNKLIIRPINYDDNRLALKNCIYRREGDIALVLYLIVFEAAHNLNTTKITREIFGFWGREVEEVWQEAMTNTYIKAMPRMYVSPADAVNPPYHRGAFMALNSDITKIGPMKFPVVTTTRQINGAIAMFYPGVMEKIAQLYDSDYYVVFSGTCEARLHRRSEANPRMLLSLLKDMNKQFPEELLSRKIYLYHRETAALEMLSL